MSAVARDEAPVMGFFMHLRACVALGGCATLLAVAAPGLARSADEPGRGAVRFERDVQPIFSQHCIRCHGAAERSGGLGLSDRDAALGELDSGLRAIVPGEPDESELLRRVAAVDPAERMPPKGEPLTADEVDTLRRWVAAGAEWPPHWAYRPLARPDLPRVDDPALAEWARTPVDHFILEKLRERGLRPSGPADGRTWLRRVTFDLTGLPPTPEDVSAFVADASPQARERVVDRLLASPHYGERWARHWMDVVHYAETHGHDQDRPRPHAWPYRDYLIRSFNEDKPYGRFVAEQVAGDVLFPDEPQAVVATGFLATGPWDESSLRDIQENTLDREIARYLDRDDVVTTVMATFTSTTIHCARCHDHKFDPITQREYYALQAVFAATDKGDRPYEPDPETGRRRRELTERKEKLPALREALDPSLLDPALQAEVAAWERQLASAATAWTVLDPDSVASENGATLTEQSDYSVLSGGERPATDVYTITAHTDLPAVTGIRLEVLTDDSLPHKGPGRQDNGNLHLNEVTVTAGPRGDPAAAKPVALHNPRADFDQQGWTIALALDGNPATAWGIYPEVGRPHRSVFEVREPLRLDGGTTLNFRLQQTHGGGHLIGRLRLSATSAPLPLPLQADVLPAEVASILRTPAEARADRQRADLAAFHLERQIDGDLAAPPPPSLVYAGSNDFQPDGSFRPAAAPRAVHVLHRGDVREPREEARPGALSCVPGLGHEFPSAGASDEGERRAALARWLTDERNVLTWRSIANRAWHYHFGRGLVDTPNDFGRMGSAPTHPELLDRLAAELIESGGSLKHLHRLIVLSATYGQTSNEEGGTRNAEQDLSVPPSGFRLPRSVDADNRLLWRMNRGRLDAESIRDAVLHATGKLDRRMGGSSVKQFIQTPGIHVTPNVDYRGFDVDDPVNHRRSVYRFVFRTLPDPFMESLDCPDASQLAPARTESVTALQALAMLNNKLVVRQSEHLAERVVGAARDPAEQVGVLYRLVLQREPDEEERAAFVDYAAKHGLANACRVLLNSNEFMFVD